MESLELLKSINNEINAELEFESAVMNGYSAKAFIEIKRSVNLAALPLAQGYAKQVVLQDIETCERQLEIINNRNNQ